MIIIIDGYNVVRTWYPHHTIDEKERYSFLQKIAHYGRKKRHKMVVVFDGGLYEWPHKEKMGGVTVIYSARESADEVIMHYLEDHKNKDILLVSSDHELNLYASKLNIVSIGAAEFIYLLKEAQKEIGNKEEGPVMVDEGETDFNVIMQQATQKIPMKDDDNPGKQALLSPRASKHDKIVLKKLKKL